MYRKCVTEISIRHQKQIEDALLQLMQKIPFEDITITRLCQEAGVTRRVFYHLFPNRTDALHALIDHTIMNTGSCHPELADESLRFFLYWMEQKPLLNALEKNNMGGILLQRMVSSVLNEDFDIRYWMKQNGWHQEQEVLVFHLSGIVGLVYCWHYSGYQKSPEEMAALLDRLLTTPFLKSTSL